MIDDDCRCKVAKPRFNFIIPVNRLQGRVGDNPTLV